MKMRDKINKSNNTIHDIFLDTSQEKLDKPAIFSKRKRQNEPAIEIKNITKTFGNGRSKTTALNNVVLNLYDKENVALLGANGAGKTTLVEILIGINKPTSGVINYNYEYKYSYQEKLGIQFQDSTYPFGLKVKDVVNFMIDIYEIKIEQNELKKIVKMFGLEPYWKKYVRSLSGGQQQRLNILLALLHKPKFIFLDELSTGLDISVKEQIIGFVNEYCQVNKINIILVSHDVAEIEMLCKRIIIMQKGSIKIDLEINEIHKQFGSVRNLLKEYI